MTAGDVLIKTILYLDHTARLGGGEIALLNLVLALDKRRFHPVVILASDGPLTERLRVAGIETHVEPLDASVLETRKNSLGPRSLLHLRQGLACLRYAFRLAGLARRLKADLIHTNSLKSDIYGGLAGRLASIPVVWHVRDSINAEYLPAWVASAFRFLARVVPRIVVANSESTLRTLRPAPRQTTATVYSGVGEHSGVTAERMAVVHDGYSLQQFPGTERAEANAERPVLALIGRISEWKGQHVFLAAAAAVRRRFPEARFWIVGAPLFGEQEYENSLHRLAEELQVTDCVEFLGFHENIPALLAQVNIVVHASTLGEPFGQVVIEGMAAGKPVIATNGGALPEIVIPGETGLLVPMCDAPAMAEAMMQLLANPGQAAAIGAAGKLRVGEHFTISHTARKLEGIYDLVTQAPAASSVTALTPEPGQTA